MKKSDMHFGGIHRLRVTVLNGGMLLLCYAIHGAHRIGKSYVRSVWEFSLNNRETDTEMKIDEARVEREEIKNSWAGILE